MRRFAVLAVLAAGCGETEERPASPPLILELYNVQDLVVCTQSMGVCDIPDYPQGCAPGVVLDDRMGCNSFIEHAKRSLPPASWNEEEGWSMVVQSGLLIVRAPEDMQRALLNLVGPERRLAE